MSQGVSVFGLGYVGCVSAACFAKEHFDVVGVDVSAEKVARVNAGKSTIVEAGIQELVEAMVAAKKLRATTDIADAIRSTHISLICVGTPSRANGSIDLTYIERVCAQIGAEIAKKPARHTIVIRSTILPGTIHDVVIPAIERASGKKSGVGFGVASNPEFLREGTSVKDFYEPPFTLIGADDQVTADTVRSLYAGLESPVHVTAVRVSETVKYACNSFHGLKVSFANEIGNLCKALKIDSHEVMRLFCEDRKLNISAAYLRPGFAFGGSCLPKDLRAITYKAKQVDVATPLLSAVLDSNQQQIARARDMVLASGARKIAILGMTFKAGTDDLRESPVVTLIEMLIGKGLQISIYDRDVSNANLVGANREYIEREIPHIWSLVKPSLADVVAGADVVVIGNGSKEFREVETLARQDQIVIDLVRAFGPRVSDERQYQGLCW